MGGMDLTQIRRYQRNFEKAKTEFKDWLADFLIKEGYKVVTLAKERTPVDTGALRASWSVGDQKLKKETGADGKIIGNIDKEATTRSLKVDGNTYYVTISNGMFYASFVEYGTRKMTGRYMLTRSLDDIRREMPIRFSNEFEAFIRRLGGA